MAGAILQKELRDYRRNRFVIYTMAALPLLFLAIPHGPALRDQRAHERQAGYPHRALPTLRTPTQARAT